MKVKAMNKSYFTLLIDTKKVLVALLEAKIFPEARKMGVLNEGVLKKGITVFIKNTQKR